MLRRVSRGHYRVSYRSEPVMEFEGDEFRGELQLRRLVTTERELDFQYDRDGRLATAVDRSRQAQDERRFAFRYDAQGHVDRVFEVQPASEPSDTPETTLRAACRYAAAGDLVEVRDALSGTWSYKYDVFHRMTRQEDARQYAFSVQIRCPGAVRRDMGAGRVVGHDPGVFSGQTNTRAARKEGRSGNITMTPTGSSRR